MQYSVAEFDIICDYSTLRTIGINSLVESKVCSILRSKELVDLSIEHTLLPTRLLILLHVRHNIPYLYIQPLP
jgi:hypothetical protein